MAQTAPTKTAYLKLTKPHADNIYDVATWNQNMDILDEGVKGAKRCKAATIVIGNTAAGHTEKDCDVLCNGTNDALKIMAQTYSSSKIARKVVLLEGTYVLERSLSISSNVVLEGMGQGITILKRGFANGATINFPDMKYSEVPYGYYLANAAVRNLTIDGQRSTYTATNNVGIQFHGTSAKANVEVSHVTVKDSYIGVAANYSENVTVQDCILIGCFKGVSLTGAGGVTVEDCTLVGDGTSGSYGIQTDTVTHTFRFTGNKSSDFGKHYYVACQKGTIEGNYMYLGASQNGVYLSNAQLIQVLGNRIKCYGSSSVGINCEAYTQNCLVSSNSIMNVAYVSSVVGIKSNYVTDCSFLGNQITCSSGSPGIEIGYGTSLQVANNTIKAPGVGIRVGYDSSGVSMKMNITGNQILNATSKGIYVRISSSKVSENMVTLSGGSATIELHATSSPGCTNNLVVNNLIEDINYIQCTNASGNVFDNNKVV